MAVGYWENDLGVDLRHTGLVSAPAQLTYFQVFCIVYCAASSAKDIQTNAGINLRVTMK